MVLQHWRGTRALNNRYDSWDSADSSHNQVRIRITITKNSSFFSFFRSELFLLRPLLIEQYVLFQSAIALTNTKSVDKWEVPRHHIKVFNILGEGCFGQVWKCEALNIDSECKNLIEK